MTNEWLELGFQTIFWRPRKIKCTESYLPNGVTIFVARKNAPLADKSCSSSLNGSYLEQIIHNRIGRLSVEWLEIWNDCLWWNSVFFYCNDISSWMHLNSHMKLANKIKKHQNMFHYSMLVTKESNNKIHDNDTTYFMGKEPILN